MFMAVTALEQEVIIVVIGNPKIENEAGRAQFGRISFQGKEILFPSEGCQPEINDAIFFHLLVILDIKEQIKLKLLAAVRRHPGPLGK